MTVRDLGKKRRPPTMGGTKKGAKGYGMIARGRVWCSEKKGERKGINE